MSTTPPTWTGQEPLPDNKTLLLEASAGTGKTWQIAHLVTRLVAEKNTPIERLLVITFTNDAAAELRDRVRARLLLARDTLADDAPEADDVLLRDWQSHPDKATFRLRLTAAYSSFDLAPISTIHGFSQRMLTQLAFESGQEAGLTLLGDVQPILDEWVADELARLYAATTVDEVALAADLGWTRKELNVLAKAVKGAVTPVLLPAPTPPMTIVDAIRTWEATRVAFAHWLDGQEATDAVAALEAEISGKSGRINTSLINATYISGHWPNLRAWVAEGAPRRNRANSKPLVWTAAFTMQRLNAAWRGTESVESWAATPLFTAYTRFIEAQDRLWALPRSSAAQAARAFLDAEVLRRGMLTYDAMLSRLADRIAAEGPHGALATAIGKRYDAALVDEFQDTDGAQWSVLRDAFQAAQKPLLLIGDPKQAIYGFRGANVYVYMEAIASGGASTQRATMRQNWRSDAGYVAAMNHLWREGSDAFALRTADSTEPPGFDYVAVTAAKSAAGMRVRVRADSAAPARTPLEIRWFDAAAQAGKTAAKLSSRDVAEDLAAQLCAREVCRLLETTELEGDKGVARPLRAGDIAVLVRTGWQAVDIQRALVRVGVASVAAGRQSVFSSPAVQWLLAWLDAVAAPGRDGQARTLATTPLIGWTLRELDDALQAADAQKQQEQVPPNTRNWNTWMAEITEWATRWPRLGFVRVWESALDHTQAMERLLSGTDGERVATDLRHLTELCHAEERRTRLSPSGLAAWLRVQVQEIGGSSGDEQAVRLESDAAAVQIVTMHSSKGLEYPVVLLPFIWAESGGSARGNGPVKFHADGGDVCLEFAPNYSAARQTAETLQEGEATQEQRRLLYVALTRARHHTVAWFSPAGQAGGEPDSCAFGALALRPQPGYPNGELPKLKNATAKSPPDDYAHAALAWQERLTQLATTSQDTIAWRVEAPLPDVPQRVQLPVQPETPLTALQWPQGRRLATTWLVTSYSALTSGRTLEGDAPKGDWEPGQGGEEPASLLTADVEPPLARNRDDDDADSPTPEPAQPTRTQAVALSSLPGGTDVGQWVHALLENLDFQTVLDKEGSPLTDLAPRLAARAGVVYTEKHAPLLDALPHFLETRLDGQLPGIPEKFCLKQLQPEDRLDELHFDLSLAGGANWEVNQPCVDPARIQAALAKRLHEDWDGAAWLKMVHDETQFAEMAGVLTGSIDLVMRVGTKFFIADYKTNKIVSQRNRQLCLRGHYAREWLAWDMAKHGYHLQALFYTLALHRFLRERLKNYAYGEHIGGHLYLYLRGMEGAEALQPSGEAYGVYTDRWPEDVVLALDAALAAEGVP